MNLKWSMAHKSSKGFFAASTRRRKKNVFWYRRVNIHVSISTPSIFYPLSWIFIGGHTRENINQITLEITVFRAIQISTRVLPLPDKILYFSPGPARSGSMSNNYFGLVCTLHALKWKIKVASVKEIFYQAKRSTHGSSVINTSLQWVRGRGWVTIFLPKRPELFTKNNNNTSNNVSLWRSGKKNKQKKSYG